MSANTDTTDTTEETRQDRKERYERVLRIVELNTGDAEGPQLPLVREQTIIHIATSAGHDAAGVSKSLRAARENGDLLRTTHYDGRARYCRAEAEALQDVIEWEIAREGVTDREFIGACNAAKQGGQA